MSDVHMFVWNRRGIVGQVRKIVLPNARTGLLSALR